MIVNSLSRSLILTTKRVSVLRSRIASYAKSAQEEKAAFWAKNQKLNRPVSPHLTIYRLPLTANMSILHRATGAAQSGLLVLLGLSGLAFAGNFEGTVYQFLLENVHPHVMLTAKFIVAFPFVYHTLTGIRHLVWDTGRGLQLPLLYKSGYTIIALAILGSLALACQ
jgi:succinate dehydrogenase (ubiquinone) cytochrome b560 subunit